MSNLKKIPFQTNRTIITEFKFHLGQYWRNAIDRKSIVVVRKAYEKNAAAVFINKVLFDQILAKALGKQYIPQTDEHPDRLNSVLHGPDPYEQNLKQFHKSS